MPLTGGIIGAADACKTGPGALKYPELTRRVTLFRSFTDAYLTLMSTTDQLNAPTLADAGPPGLDHGPGSIETIIRPSKGWIPVDWRELYNSRELFDTLVFRDIKVRYKQTVLGVAWAVIQPLLTMVVFTALFGRFPGVKTPGIPYALFVFAGLVPWTFFTNAVSGAGLSLVNQQQLLTKIYFPRLFVPAAVVGAYLVDLAIGLMLFAVLLPFYHFTPSWWVLALPLVVVLNFVAAFGVSLILAAMTILYRDLRFVIPFLMQILMFASAVFYRPDNLTRPQQLAVSLNPMWGIIGAYRASILGMPLDWASLAISAASSAAMLWFGLNFFRKTERLFADIA